MLQIATWKRLVIWGLVLLGLYFASPNGFYDRVETHNDAVATIETTGTTPELEADRSAWPDWAPNALVNLGLDLRGGAHLLAEVQVEDVYEARMDGYWPEIRNALRDERATIGTIRRQDSSPSELRVKISKPEALPQAIELVRGLAQPVVSLSGVGSTDIEVNAGREGEFVVTLSEAERVATDDRTIQQSLEIIRRRVDEVGTREPTIQRQGTDRILIQVPGIGSASELKEIIGKTAKLTFNPVVSRTTDAATTPGPRNVLYPSIDEEGVFYVLEQTPVVTGEQLNDAQPAFDQNGQPAVNFRFNVSGARLFCDYTGANVGAPFAIVLDEEVISAPRINEQICGGSGIITGNFSIEESTNLAVLLRAGALPAELTYVEERTIGPELGQDSIDAGKIASIVAFAAVLIFMVASYGWFGVIANIALILNVGMIFGLLSMIGATLTLPGIAGIVLTIGMAVDANVLVFERIREELKAGRGPARAIELGYEKALSAILDANITTFITAVILFVMGSGPVRGFSVTLGLGIITSVFTAIFLTRLMVVMWFERKRPRNFQIKGIRLAPQGRVFDFFKRTIVSLGASGAAMVASIMLFLVIGLNFGIDFRGGTTIRTESTLAVDVGSYREALTPLALGDISIVQVNDVNFRADQHVSQIRIEAQEGQEAITPETMVLIEQALAEVDPAITFPSVESVGPKVSGELVTTAVLAVVAAIAAVLVYIWLRFEWQFSLGAVAALVHDVVLTIGIFSLLGIKFDLAIIAALLTIVGYSLNDTVVVFDRVRENLRRYKKMDLKEVLNLSINETLARTMMTSVTTLLALIALYVLGGDVIRGFVFAMIWGVVVGTYSSIFVASAILLRLGVKRDWSKPDATAGNQFANVDA
ncbi:protein translocase subunit secF /protein translocase subunit secD [Aliiroseovarius halocynthiae]|uniref:Multifunctional fusion protein n=1 Tax=Aliiroseovarius halocynthiae TaxID=985055 RepID=A0A545SUH9_9RHOB|nr:protein translocase subunit SecD [Aliiroseovarius halocynthiae]TQV68604.1 protein translocase subunit SecD [Aliiroseovarius halocynthiae]SMR71016.1 protein translocase subunit secF /protein translocase subunit secD [Aliiroseovarius halocynthiae]